jgi:hypothetical protein
MPGVQPRGATATDRAKGRRQPVDGVADRARAPQCPGADGRITTAVLATSAALDLMRFRGSLEREASLIILMEEVIVSGLNLQFAGPNPVYLTTG